MDETVDSIRRAAPFTDEQLASPAIAGAVAEVARATAGHVSKRDVRRRRLLVAVAVSALLAPVAIASSQFISARTGWFGNAALTEEDGSEWLRTDARDFPAVAASLVPTLPLPRGAAWQDEVDRQVRVGRTNPGLMQATGVARTFESYARCAWLADWQLAFTADDADREARALEVLDDSLTWPALVATDGGGVIASMAGVNSAAHRGDLATVERWAPACSGFDLKGVR